MNVKGIRAASAGFNLLHPDIDEEEFSKSIELALVALQAEESGH
jgi:hypothetical protein